MRLIVRDRMGNPVSIPLSAIPEEIRPDNWFENPDWRNRPDRDELKAYIYGYLTDHPLSEETVKRLAQYIIDYACHIAVSVYLFSPPNYQKREGLEFNRECIKRLREIDPKTREDLRILQSIALEYALDPF